MCSLGKEVEPSEGLHPVPPALAISHCRAYDRPNITACEWTLQLTYTTVRHRKFRSCFKNRSSQLLRGGSIITKVCSGGKSFTVAKMSDASPDKKEILS